MQIALILLRADLDKSLRDTEAWFNDSIAVREELNLDTTPDHTTLCRWEKKFDMRELRRLLRRSAEQAGWTGFGAVTPVASSAIRRVLTTGIGRITRCRR